MDGILGNREAINPRHMLESSSSIEAQSSPQVDQDIRDKQNLDEEVWAAASAKKRKLVQSYDLPGPSGEICTSDSEEDESLVFAKSLFFKNKANRESAQVYQRVVQRIHQRIEKMERKQPERRPMQQQ